jgi:hypothetical protein
MRYTVLWRREALDELAIAWMMAADREAVTVASAQIDRLLRAAPLEQGESREEGTRVLLIPPLGAEYEVEEGDRKVYVNSVWRTR